MAQICVVFPKWHRGSHGGHPTSLLIATVSITYIFRYIGRQVFGDTNAETERCTLIAGRSLRTKGPIKVGSR